MMDVPPMMRRIKDGLKRRLDNARWEHLGKGSRVVKPMRILGRNHISIGPNVSILNDARLETIREWKGHDLEGHLVISSGTSIEQRCHIVAAGELVIGEDCVISADVYISDCAHGLLASDRIMDQPLDVRKTAVGKGCFIGIGAKIMPGVILGEHCVVGANAVVTHSMPPYSIVAGVPARQIGTVEHQQ